MPVRLKVEEKCIFTLLKYYHFSSQNSSKIYKNFNGGKRLIIKKKRINRLKCLEWLEEGQKIVMALPAAMRFKEKLLKLGFTERFEEGERILPKIVNPTTARNAEKFYIPDKTQPKEKYYQTLWWTRKEWAGRGETREVSEYVDIPRERYHQIEYEPYSVELILKYDDSGNLMVVTDATEYKPHNHKRILNTINIFLTNFEECEILTAELDTLMPTKTVYLNWEVLPQGEYPWSKIEKDLDRISEGNSKTNRKMMIDKCEYINGFKPDFRAYGKSGFNGYVILGFEKKNLYVLESVYPNNATYVFSENWQELSRLTKAQILNGGLQDARLIHKESWRADVRKLLEGN